MERLFHYQITESQEGCTVRGYLRSLGYSRNLMLHLRQTPRGLLHNGEATYGSAVLRAGDTLDILLKEDPAASQISPIPMKLQILYEDEDLLVLNKPADTPIHPSAGNRHNTLANGVAYYFQSKGESFVYRCINRLDRDTTGALILAKHAYGASLLSSAIQRRQIHRTYLALVEGSCPDQGIIRAPIARKPTSILEREVNAQTGAPACTHYECLDRRNGLSLVQLRLETGRTHQIRVHMLHLGYPLLGDYLYHPEYSRIHRVSLHSYQLDFVHPITGQPLCLCAPVPEDFLIAWETDPSGQHP